MANKNNYCALLCTVNKALNDCGSYNKWHLKMFIIVELSEISTWRIKNVTKTALNFISFHFTQTLSVIARNGFRLSQYTSTPGFIFTSFWIRQMAQCTTSILHQLDVTICIPFSVRTIIKCIL